MSATPTTRGWYSRATVEAAVNNMRGVTSCHSVPRPWHTLHEEVLVIIACTTMNVRPAIYTHRTSTTGGSNDSSIFIEGPFAKVSNSDKI